MYQSQTLTFEYFNNTSVNVFPRHTKDVIKMVPVVPLFSTEHSKWKILALSQEKKTHKKTTTTCTAVTQ